jgi:hypothetical protein
MDNAIGNSETNKINLQGDSSFDTKKDNERNTRMQKENIPECREEKKEKQQELSQ